MRREVEKIRGEKSRREEMEKRRGERGVTMQSDNV